MFQRLRPHRDHHLGQLSGQLSAARQPVSIGAPMARVCALVLDARLNPRRIQGDGG